MDQSEIMARMIDWPVASQSEGGWYGALSAYADCLAAVQSALSEAEMTRFLAVGALIYRNCCEEEAKERWTPEAMAAFHRKRPAGA